MSGENERIADWLMRVTHNQRNWGFSLCYLFLRNVKGNGWNHKRVYRISGAESADQAEAAACARDAAASGGS